jgi:hypothetical protein
VRARAAPIAALAAALCAPSAHAQQIAENGRAIYEAAFFQPYSPANALQIVERVPGFTLDKGNSEIRGFGQAAGNVVINGQRPSAKSETLETVLARIPASRIVRVELVSGEQFGSDYAGKPQVVNIVMSEGGGIAGTAEATFYREFIGRILPEGSVSALIRRGPSSFNVAASLRANVTSEEGTDRITDVPGGAQRELRIKLNRRQEQLRRGSVSWALEEGDNRSAHLNATIGSGAFILNQTNHVIPRGAAERDDTLYNRYFARTIEMGGDVNRPLAGGGIKLVGLITRRHRDRDDISTQTTSAGVSQGGIEQNLKDWREESVARLTWAHPKLAGWSVELGVEGALNRLKSKLNLVQVNGAGTKTLVDLPLDNAVVTEYRGEAFANVGRDLQPGLRLDFGLTYEASRLKVTGDAQAKRSLQFLKPKATLDWRPGGWHAQVTAQRNVAQLNFENFISSADIGSERVNGGNAELLPQRAWEFLASVDRAILGDGRIKLDIGYNLVGKVQDRVKVRDAKPATATEPAVPALDAPGNLGNGTEFILRGNVDVPLGGVGIKGGRLSLYGEYVKSSVVDPYTRRSRPFTGKSLFEFTVNFRQDLGKFAWGFEVEGDTPWTLYRLDETDEFVEIVPTVDVFAEYRPSQKWTFILGARNLTDVGIVRHRDFFRPDREQALIPSFREDRARNTHVLGYFTVKASFG